MRSPTSESWPVIVVYVFARSGARGPRAEFEPFSGATPVELSLPRGPGLLWGMWNTIARAEKTGAEAFLNAVIVPAHEPGKPPIQFEPIVGHEPAPLRLPADSAALNAIRTTVSAAMRKVTGQEDPKSAARTLRTRAIAAAKQRRLNAAGGSVTSTSASPAAATAPDSRVRARTANPKANKRTTKRAAKNPAPGKARHPASEPRMGPAFDVDSGIRLTQDPDAEAKMVWAFRSGRSYHRGDCHLVEARGGAVQIPIAVARKRNLDRCMHCAPTVR